MRSNKKPPPKKAPEAPTAPTLAQRIEDLRADVDAALDQLAEEKHPPSVPGPWMRQNWMGKANGNLFEAYLIGRKEFPE